MSWAKRNLYFLISCVLAVALLGAAGWYCYSEWQANDASRASLEEAYGKLKEFGKGPVTPSTENIEAANKEARRAQELADGLRKHLVQIPSIPDTTNIDDRILTPAVRGTIAQLALSAEANHVTVPLDFAFSFSAQKDKVVFAAAGRDQLARELGEVKVICDVLLSNRIDSLELLQRERTADDAIAAATASQNDYLDSISVTNNNTIITPYRVTFLCFDAALSSVLTGFANQPYGIMVRTLEVGPADLTGTEMGTAPMSMPERMGPGGMGPGGVPNQYPGVNPAAPGLGSRGGLPVVVDEKKLRVSMLLELVRIVPTPGK